MVRREGEPVPPPRRAAQRQPAGTLSQRARQPPATRRRRPQPILTGTARLPPGRRPGLPQPTAPTRPRPLQARPRRDPGHGVRAGARPKTTAATSRSGTTAQPPGEEDARRRAGEHSGRPPGEDGVIPRPDQDHGRQRRERASTERSSRPSARPAAPRRIAISRPSRPAANAATPGATPPTTPLTPRRTHRPRRNPGPKPQPAPRRTQRPPAQRRPPPQPTPRQTPRGLTQRPPTQPMRHQPPAYRWPNAQTPWGLTQRLPMRPMVTGRRPDRATPGCAVIGYQGHRHGSSRRGAGACTCYAARTGRATGCHSGPRGRPPGAGITGRHPAGGTGHSERRDRSYSGCAGGQRVAGGTPRQPTCGRDLAQRPT